MPPLVLRYVMLPPHPMNLQPAGVLLKICGPLVSILMMVNEAQARIGSAIRLLLEQTCRDIELTVVDDASSGNTGEIVKASAKLTHGSNMRVCRVFIAEGIGLLFAMGEFVTCHDSDDWSHPLRIERQVVPLLKNKRLVFTTSHWVRMQNDGIYYARPVYPLMRINSASYLSRRELVIENAGG